MKRVLIILCALLPVLGGTLYAAAAESEPPLTQVMTAVDLPAGAKAEIFGFSVRVDNSCCT